MAKAKWMWVLVTPRGRVCWDTINETLDGMWFNGGFHTVTSLENDQYGMDYWKRKSESKAEAKNRGYKFARVRCEVES